MKFVEWCDLFVIGHEVIDKQHRTLFEIANRFHDSVNRGFDPKTSVNTLNQLIQYAQKHFSDEEQIAHDLKMPVELLDHHQQVHDKLITDVFTLNERIESGQVVDMATVETFIREWLVLHVLIEDQKYKPYLEGTVKTPDAKKTVKKTLQQGPTTVKYP